MLQKERDRSAVFVQVGFFTNAARLLDSPGAPALVAKKVKSLLMMAGEFPAGPAEYNVRIDIPAAKRVFAAWPTPLVTSGFEIGKAILYPARAIDTYFRYAERHPVAGADRAYKVMPYDRPAVLRAARPGASYFTLSKPGAIAVDDKGATAQRVAWRQASRSDLGSIRAQACSRRSDFAVEPSATPSARCSEQAIGSAAPSDTM